MRRLKLAVLSAALLFITTAVFSERASFVPQDVYVDTQGSGNPADMQKIIDASAFPELNTSNQGIQAKIQSSNSGNPLLNLYTKDGVVFKPLFNDSNF